MHPLGLAAKILQSTLTQLREENKKLKKELAVTDELYERYNAACQAIPECEAHGAMDWIGKMKKLDSLKA